MSKNVFIGLGLVSLMALPAIPANATEIKGYYVNLGAGGVIPRDQDASTHGHGMSVKHDTGFTGYGAFGYGYGNGLRVEVEGVYLQSGISSIGGNPASGHEQSYGGLLNVVYDIDLNKHFGINTIFTPYVGVGAGYMANSYRTHSVHSIGGTQGSFAYQAIIGTSVDTGIPGLQATVDYRLIGQPMSNDSYHEADTSFHHSFDHTFTVGLRYAFDTAPAPITSTVVAPTPTPTRTYLVFFDWDKSILTESAKKIIRNAASAATHVNTTRIEVNGYSDTSSSRGGKRGEAYNLALSERRAEAVEEELIKNGIEKKFISITALGDTHPLVKTGPNVREAQNRRVEIILK